jgi:hypothetical protein
MERLLIQQLIDEAERDGKTSETIQPGETFALFPSMMEQLHNDPVKDSQRAGEYLLVLPQATPEWPAEDEWPTMEWEFHVIGLRSRSVYAQIKMGFNNAAGNYLSVGDLAPRIEFALNRPESVRTSVRKVYNEANKDTKCAYCDARFPDYDSALDHELDAHREKFPEVLLPPPA